VLATSMSARDIECIQLSRLAAAITAWGRFGGAAAAAVYSQSGGP
jgi:hypothetical protein